MDLLRARELLLVPVLNPDGLARNEATHPAGGGMQRKNMAGPAVAVRTAHARLQTKFTNGMLLVGLFTSFAVVVAYW